MFQQSHLVYVLLIEHGHWIEVLTLIYCANLVDKEGYLHKPNQSGNFLLPKVESGGCDQVETKYACIYK